MAQRWHKGADLNLDQMLGDILKVGFAEVKIKKKGLVIGQLIFEARPQYCDRGNFLVKAFSSDILTLFLDSSDGFPRYYFNPQTMISEMILWADKNNLKVPLDLEG